MNRRCFVLCARGSPQLNTSTSVFRCRTNFKKPSTIRFFSSQSSTDGSADTVKPVQKKSISKAPSSPLRGTKDLFPDVTRYYNFIESSFKSVLSKYGYNNEIRTPIIEHKDVFNSTLGADSEVVMKQMYLFDDHGVPTVLRPESTASVMRAVVKRGLLPIQDSSSVTNEVAADTFSYSDKMYYCGPMFRRERPQAGRMRQFTQFGIECIGSDHPMDDVQVVTLASEALASIGLLPYLTLAINSLGTREDREKYHSALMQYLTTYKPFLSAESRKRVDMDMPLRVLDSKDPEDVIIVRGLNIRNDISNIPEIFDLDSSALAEYCEKNGVELGDAGLPEWPPAGAPILRDYMSADSKARFGAVLTGLDISGVSYVVDDYLLRGLDYYSHTAFEFLIRTDEGVSIHTNNNTTSFDLNSSKATSLSPGAYSAVLGGGRYDGLAARFGDKTPNNASAVGWAAGMERLYLHMQNLGLLKPLKADVDVTIVVMAPKMKKGSAFYTDVAESGKLVSGKTLSIPSEYGKIIKSNSTGDKQSSSSSTAAVLMTSALMIAQNLRNQGIRVNFEPNLPYRTQLLNNHGANFAVIVGESEVMESRVLVKNLYERTQEHVDVTDLGTYIQNELQ